MQENRLQAGELQAFLEAHPSSSPSHKQMMKGLGLLYGLGESGKNTSEAFDILSKVPDDGEGSIHYYLGICYFDGQGVVEDKARAVELFKLSVEKGYIPAIYKLIDCYKHAEGVAIDWQEIKRLYSLLLVSDDPDILYEVACFYKEHKKLLNTETETHYNIIERAANNGHTEAQYQYASYSKSHSENNDLARALHYYELAASKEHKEAL